MKTTKDMKEGTIVRPRIALITNHGYAGIEIPVGGAPDTGGQNFYVNSLAKALDEIGMEVTIFARGGFPFFNSTKIRNQTEYLSEHVRYVYIIGGGKKFIRKEDIAIALDEETTWLEQFIRKEAAEANVDPWDYYDCINTHYWDAGLIGYKLVEKWQNQVAYKFLEKANNGIFANHLKKFAGNKMHMLGLSREINLHIGHLGKLAFPHYVEEDVFAKILGHIPTEQNIIEPSLDTARSYKTIERSYLLGSLIFKHLTVDNLTLKDVFHNCNTHVWTPHSIGIIKERNFWNKEYEIIRNLKFRERTSHEETVCKHTPLFCSTSLEIWQSLVSYHDVLPSDIFDFPPCIDETIFKPRKVEELTAEYEYLSKVSSVSVKKLKESKILFETSRMDKTKRKDILLKSFAKVTAQRNDVYLFIGGGPSSCDLFKELTALKESMPELNGRAFLLDFIPEPILEPLFSLPDLFVSASEMEGFGMSVSQSAAAGVAIITSELIPFAAQYAPKSALIVKTGDIDGFANAILYLLQNDEERQHRSNELLEIAGELNWKATASRFLEWYYACHKRNSLS